MKKRAVIYLRVSTDEQKESGYSLGVQLTECRKYAESLGFEVVGTHYYKAESGKLLEVAPDDPEAFPAFVEDYTGTVPIELRPEGMKAYELLTTGKADALIAFRFDRLVRPPKDGDEVVFPAFIRSLADMGKEIHVANRGKLGSTLPEVIMSLFEAKSAGDHRRRLLEATANGMRGKAKAGRYVAVGKPPYGYARQFVKDKTTGAIITTGVSKRPLVQLAIDGHEARIVVFIFTWFVYGDETGRPLSLRAIARKLTGIGIAAPGVSRGSVRKQTAPAHWNAATIGKMIMNEVYAGKWHFGRMDCTNCGKNGKKLHRPRDKKDWITIDVDPIIDRNLWLKAQAQMQENRSRTVLTPKYEYLMQSRLTCGHCNHSLSGHTRVGDGNIYSYYACRGKGLDLSDDWKHPRCKAHNTRVDVVDAYVWKWLEEIFSNPEKLVRGLRSKQAEQEQNQGVSRSRLAAIITEIDSYRAQLGRLIDLSTAANSKTTRELFAEKEAQLNQAIANLERERANIESRIAEAVIPDETIQTLEKRAHNVEIAFKHASFAERRALVEMMDVRGTIKTINKAKSALELSCILSDTSMYTIEGFYARRGQAIQDPAPMPISNLLASSINRCYNFVETQAKPF